MSVSLYFNEIGQNLQSVDPSTSCIQNVLLQLQTVLATVEYQGQFVN